MVESFSRDHWIAFGLINLNDWTLGFLNKIGSSIFLKIFFSLLLLTVSVSFRVHRGHNTAAAEHDGGEYVIYEKVDPKEVSFEQFVFLFLLHWCILAQVLTNELASANSAAPRE